MYKLIVVDDEKQIRSGLSRYIANADLGFDVVADFEDGTQAIEYLTDNNVDAVLTDIQMARVSGIELAKWISENRPIIKVVIISGYKEFEYAQKAIEYNVQHYILKPTKLDEVNEVFTRIKENLEKEKSYEKSISDEQEKFKELLPILKEQFFCDLYMGILGNKSDIEKKLKIIDLNVKPGQNPCCIINVDVKNYENYLAEKWHYGKEEFGLAIRNFILEQSSDIQYYYIFGAYDRMKIIALSLKDISADSLQIIVNFHLNEIVDSIKKVFDLDVEMSVEKNFDNLFEVATYRVSSAKNDEIRNQKALLEQYKLFISNISIGNYEQTINIFDQLIDEVSLMPISLVQEKVKLIFTNISDEFNKIGIDIYKLTGADFDISIIFTMQNIDVIKNWGYGILQKMVNHFSTDIQLSSDIIINKAKEYIDNHYSSDISLDDVANYVFLTPVYFSRFFKNKTNESFTDYLIKVRMKQAIKLLMQNTKIYEVSELVGYKSSKYFIRLFKKYTGYTPKEYCLKILKVGGNIGS
jgi:two-component system response regulator YesN